LRWHLNAELNKKTYAGLSLGRVFITLAAAAHPENRIRQEDAADRMAAVTGDPRRLRAIARGTRIDTRAFVLTPDEIEGLGSIEQRNDIYQAEAPKLAARAVCSLSACLDETSFLVTSSCTGYMIPGLDVQLAQTLALRPSTARLPITEAGCAGGAVAIARASDYLRSREDATSLVVAAELCSLAFHPDSEEGNLTSALLFGDGAGALLLRSSNEALPGLEVVDSASALLPCPPEVLGFRLTDAGFYPMLSRSLVDKLPGPTVNAVACLLACHGLRAEDIDFWLVHPGGPRILEALQKAMAVDNELVQWSWQSMQEFGNTSSAAIFDVIARYMRDDEAPRGWGIVLAFGPGVSIELLLVRRC
jgi:alkylresorcinol/alkylpyrone synthase